ncbi:MAG: DUF4012 domain-containing protein [Anaerolineae bacterium]|nr:DUF4012 domain-containing protein [Anaerolineae bacterium]
MKFTKPNINNDPVSYKRQSSKASSLVGHLLIYLGLVALGFCLILGAAKGYRVYTSYQKINTEVSHLEAIGSRNLRDLSAEDLAQLKANLSQISAQFEQLQQEIEPLQPLLDRLGWVPVYGGDLRAVPELLAIGHNLSRTAVILVEVLSDPLLKMREPGWLSTLVIQLDDSQADLDTALTLLYQSQADMGLIPVETLSPALAQRVQAVQQLLPDLTAGVEFVAGLPALLGINAPQTYLILNPNADELRPIGGFVTMAGHITFDRGRIVDFQLQNSATVDDSSNLEDYPYPPNPLYVYMKASYWLLRDVTWSPDFPSTAETAIDLYEIGQGIRADGVISLDQYGLVQLLRAFKPLNVDGEQVTSDNVLKLMRWHWSPESWNGYEGPWGPQRKSFMGELSEVIWQTIEQQPSAIKLPVLVQSVRQALAEKRLLIYLTEPPPQSHMAEKNWSGALWSGDGDYLMMADANVGFNKASAVVQRGLAYGVTLAGDGSAKAQAHLTYQHQGQPQTESCLLGGQFNPVYEESMQTCYWNYMRLITPAAAQLVSGPAQVVASPYTLRLEATTGQIDVEPILDKQSWGQLFLLAPGNTVSLDFAYELPAGVARQIEEALWEYKLYLQKQPGTSTTDTQVTVTLPTGAQVMESQPPAPVEPGGTMTFSTDLKTDWQLVLYYYLSQKE